MATFTVLRDVGESLKKLIRQNITELSGTDSVVFDSPADIESSSTPKLSVFLYQITENSYLRNALPQPLGISQLQYPALTLDLYYLFTPYAQNRETELIIIEKLMQVCYDNSVLKGQMLAGNLSQTENTEVRVTPYPLTLEELNKLWGTFSNKPFKLSVSYLLTPVKIPSERKRDITRVVEKDIDLYRIGAKG